MKADASDLRNRPAYGAAEAARYLRIPIATLRTWLVGRDHPEGDVQRTFRPLITPASSRPPQLSFYNLIEAHALRGFRTERGVALVEFRKAMAYAERKLRLHRLLLSPELQAYGGQAFLDRYVELINLSASGQLAMRKRFEEHLQRVEWDEWRFPVRLYPYIKSTHRSSERTIAIDPRIAFGRPVVRRRGVSTAIIADRIDAGETVRTLADDDDLSPEEIEQAVLYSRAV